jgi:hypothetical protein
MASKRNLKLVEQQPEAPEEVAIVEEAPRVQRFVFPEAITLPTWRARQDITFSSNGIACTIHAGNEFTTDELEFDPATMEVV